MLSCAWQTSPSLTHLTKSCTLSLTEMIVLFSVTIVLYWSYRCTMHLIVSQPFEHMSLCLWAPWSQGQQLISGAQHLAGSSLLKSSILRHGLSKDLSYLMTAEGSCAVFIKLQSCLSLCEMILFIPEIFQLSPISISPNSLSLKM